MARQQGHHLNILSEGELESITKPLSSNQRQSRACSNTSSLPVGSASTSANSRLHSSMAASLQLLTPEEVMEQDYDLSLEDIGSDSQAEYTSDDAGTEATDNINTGRTSSIFGTCVADPRPGKLNYDKQENLSADEDDEEYLASRQLTLFGSVTDEAESDIDSEEENDICRQIKEEIKAQMKEEMRGELALMHAHHKHQSAENEDKNADLNDLEPELRAAILKMRKLDRILLRKMKKEKEVKRDRILLQKRVRAELEELKLSGQAGGGGGGGGESSDIKKNTDKFLALELPPSHNAGVKVDEPAEDMDSPPVTPLFQTQLPDDVMGGRRNADGAGAGSQSAGGTTSAASNRSAPSEANSAGTRTSSQRREANKRKNFIRRNRELAADAQNTIAMTDDEKQRLEGLLQDIDSLPDIPENSDEGSEVSSVNPYQITLSSGEGFLPTQDEMKRLDAIDTRLRALLPPDDYESIASSLHPHSSHQEKPNNAWTYEDPNKEPSFFITQGRIPSPEPLPVSPDDQSVLFTRTTLHSVDVDQLGEKALKETKEHRDLQQRLKDIENELECLSSAVELELESPHLSNNQLDYLLDQCARTMSRATAETDSLASNTARSSQSSSSRQSLYDNPPHLPEEVLQQLLADARQSMGEGSSSDGYGQVQLAPHNSDGATLESVTEETLQELLDNPRTTSRQTSRTPFQHFSSESRPDSSSSSLPREPFLPKIDPTGTMSTQRLNNDRLNESQLYSRPSTGRSSAVTVRNTFSDGVVNGHGSPHPPPPSSSANGRRSGSGGKHRTVSPFTHNSLD